MNRFSRMMVLTFISAATFLPAAVHAAVVAVSHERLNQCGRGNVVCDGVQAFSLTALESGLVQLPISPNAARDFVIVNDTGAPVRVLQFSFFGALSSNTDLTCHIEAGANRSFHSCTVVGSAAAGDGSSTLRGLIDPPAEFTYIADSSQAGIPDGGYFDISVAGFSHDGYDRGYLTGTATVTNPGGGSGSGSGPGCTGPGCPPFK